MKYTRNVIFVAANYGVVKIFNGNTFEEIALLNGEKKWPSLLIKKILSDPAEEENSPESANSKEIMTFRSSERLIEVAEEDY